MEEFGKIRWFIKENCISASLMNWYVDIEITMNDKNLYYSLRVCSDGKELLRFNFYTLEDAINFTNNVINKSWTTEEIVDKYKTMFGEDSFSLPEEASKEANDKITLSPDDVYQALFDYFCTGKDFRVSVKEKLKLENGQPDLSFYLVEHHDYNGTACDKRIRLTDGDLMNAFKSYVEFYGYDLIDFKYIGGVHKVGYYFDRDTPHYEGIELRVKKKEKDYNLERKLK